MIDLHFYIDTDIGRDYKIYDYQKGLLINRAIREFLEDQRDFGRKAHKRLAPLGETGRLRGHSLRWKRKIRETVMPSSITSINSHFTTLSIGSVRRRPGEGFKEAHYPLFVHEGVQGRIRARSGNVLALRDKNTRKIKSLQKSVPGQKAQGWFSGPGFPTVQKLISTNFSGPEKGRLRKKIANIISS